MTTYGVSDYKPAPFPLHKTLCYLLLCLVVVFVNSLPCIGHENIFDVKALCVGKELWRETLPLQLASRVYNLEGLKLNSWYEVKISYPASIPAWFSLQLLKNGEMGLKLNRMRRLLNTEKLVFKAGSLEEAGLNVLVTVEPEGIVPIPNSEERSFIMYNIVCEEQLMGMPYSSWSVVILVALCLVVAFIVPRFLPSALLVKNQGGFIASWLVKFLLSRGYTVHGTVRDPCDEKNDHLRKLDNAAKNLKLFKADLYDYEGLSSAIAGCSGVFHIASRVPFEGVPLTEEELIKPALTGTKNVLEACTDAKVKKVVVVSSIAAVVYNPKWPQDVVKDEDCWSDTQYVYSLEGYWRYYYLAKTLMERQALEWSKKSLANVVMLCPSVTIGPRLQSTLNSSSLGLLKFIKGGIKSLLSDQLYLVDVRDVANALLLVYENPETKGRYICNSHSLHINSLMEKLKNMYPKRSFPESFMEGKEKELNEVRPLSSEKLQNLGWKFRPLEETIDDSVVSFEVAGDLPKP